MRITCEHDRVNIMVKRRIASRNHFHHSLKIEPFGRHFYFIDVMYTNLWCRYGEYSMLVINIHNRLSRKKRALLGEFISAIKEGRTTPLVKSVINAMTNVCKTPRE